MPRLPAVDFEDEDFLEVLFPLIEKHQILMQTDMTQEMKWEHLVEELYDKLDQNKFRQSSALNMRRKFNLYKKDVQKMYSSYLKLDPSTPIDSEDIPDPYQLELVNLLRSAPKVQNTKGEDHDEESKPSKKPPGKSKNGTGSEEALSKQLRFSDDDGEVYFQSTPPNEVESESQPKPASKSPPTVAVLTKANTKKNTGPKPRKSPSKKRSRVTMEDGEDEDEDSGQTEIAGEAENKELDDAHLLVDGHFSLSDGKMKRKGSKPGGQQHTASYYSVMEKELDVRLQETKNQGKVLDLEIEKLAVEKLKQQIRLQTILNH